jgi:hypothetical protein
MQEKHFSAAAIPKDAEEKAPQCKHKVNLQDPS